VKEIEIKNTKIESREQRIEQLKKDCQVMEIVLDDLRNFYNPERLEIAKLLKERILNNKLDRMLILKEIEIIRQQP